MKYVPLGTSGLSVSNICLGTMTWGVQNSQADADEQLDYALEQGVNFIDTAEIYPAPPSEQTQGNTERIIGDWLTRNPARRADIYLATKVAGKNIQWIRDGDIVTSKSIMAAVDGSLSRLKTDYIDLYQFHWPNRLYPHFNRHFPSSGLDYNFENTDDTAEQIDNMLDILQGLQRCVKAGKIRHFGLSNETPWGLMQYLRLAETEDVPRIVSMQNEFSLIHATDWPFMLEACARENITYLPWSPIGGGALSGKYKDSIPEGTRWSIRQRNGVFRNQPNVHKAVAGYTEVATKYGITSAQLALLWCLNIDAVSSPIIGATTMAQLRENLAVADMEYTPEMDADIMAVFRAYPVPF